MMRIGVFTDLHANLPALKKAIEVFQNHGCERIIHVGDLIGIGPYPAECIELALATSNMEFVMGNHDYWYAHGLPDPVPGYMHPDEVAHQRWTHKQIGENFQQAVQNWPFSLTIKTMHHHKISFLHYALNHDKSWFRSIIKNPEDRDVEELFKDTPGDLIFYGHLHIPHDCSVSKRYINLGSAGCHHQPVVRLAVLDCLKKEIAIKKLAVEYEDDGLLEEFDRRNVPAKAFIRKVFITR
jgi:putative phosphoesterase